MSKETAQWLNTMTLIGMTDVRGKAWHYRESEQGVEANHYEREIPIEDVRRRLFGWEVMTGDVTTNVINESGVFTLTDPRRKTMVRPPGALGPDDEGAILGIFKDGYQGHGYDQWLLTEVASILDDNLIIGSAGLLAGGAQAWVQVEIPENITTPEGVVFRPNLLATTSFDGTLATTYKRTITNVVCDNTMAAGLAENGATFKVKHTRNSGVKLAEARDALDVVHTIADDFAAEVAELTSIKVSEGDWSKFLDTLAPTEDKTGRGLTVAQNKRDALNVLWRDDERVSPWKNTAFGVVQAVNTFDQHGKSVRGGAAKKAERNMANAVRGNYDVLDRTTAKTIKALVNA
jgi:phage/plasmid-like protein (TIGR03299 family)